MLQAMNTGHDGSLTTVHANSASDALYRLDTMVAMANLNIPERAIRQQIASAINLVVHMSRMADGTRKVTSVTELTGMEGEVISMQDIFVFERTGINAQGKVCGRFRATGIRPKISERLTTAGHPAAAGHVRAREAHQLTPEPGRVDSSPDIRARSWHRARHVLAVRRASRAGDRGGAPPASGRSDAASGASRPACSAKPGG